MSPELFPRKELAPEFDGPRTAVIGTLAFHLVLILALAFAPPFQPPAAPPPGKIARRVTPLVDPPVEMTQKAPNKKPLSKELNVQAIPPRPVVQAPAPAPTARKTFSPPPLAVAENAPKPQPTIQPPPEPPKIELPKEAPKLPAIATQVGPPPSQENPKLAFQTPGAPPAASVTRPNPAFASPSVDQAVRNLARGEGAGGQSVGDAIDGSGPGLNLPTLPGSSQSNLELKSDPMGVDFKPYLIRVLATVKRNWFAIYPEAARLGTRGKVVVEFAIVTDGKITKIVYTSQSGSRALDEAAVAALSASNPLPSLPANFKGQRIVLQFTFSYNIRTR